MKKYMNPELNVILVEAEDVITNSPASILNANEFENDTQWWKNVFNS